MNRTSRCFLQEYFFKKMHYSLCPAPFPREKKERKHPKKIFKNKNLLVTYF
jgi:hypothetical protein